MKNKFLFWRNTFVMVWSLEYNFSHKCHFRLIPEKLEFTFEVLVILFLEITLHGYFFVNDVGIQAINYRLFQEHSPHKLSNYLLH